MLATDEVDEDYFTPASNTSLANIFESRDEDTEMTENESLKYTPPKKPNNEDVSQNTEAKPEEESKATECVYACALTAHEWEHGHFAARGLLGFAILKITKTNCHNIVLYDSKKLTLSSVPVTPKLKIIYKTDSMFLSYYDSLNKYWSLHGKQTEIDKIIEILTTLGVTVTYEFPKENSTENQPEVNKENERKNVEEQEMNLKSEKESDTDSSVNKKTKASILSRMANMGQSVLPPNTNVSIEKSSESSDSNEFIPTYNQLAKIRTKPKQFVTKRSHLEKKIDHELVEMNKMYDLPTCTSTLYTIVNGQLVPAANFNDTSNDLNLFMSEQRMNNNEMRININRATDKVDKVLDKIKCLEQSAGDKNFQSFQTDIMQKLLLEYEVKIKNYELMLNSKEQSFTSKTTELQPSTACNNADILKLQAIIKDKEKEITELHKNHEDSKIFKEKQIEYLGTTITSKNEEIEKLSKELVELKRHALNKDGRDLENEIKEIMNEVYLAVSDNYKDEQTYSGQQVKKTIASVIKKTTLNYLNKHHA